MDVRALIIGVERYEDEQNNLDGVSNDVEAISRVLEKFGITKHQRTVIKDEDATKDNIEKELKSLITGVSNEDIRILYFSGHGIQLPHPTIENEYVEGLVPHDGTVSKLILDAWLAELLKDVPCNFWGIYDACHSGNMFKPLANDKVKELFLEDLEDDSGGLAPVTSPSVALANRITVKRLIKDGTIKKAVHIAAVSEKKQALVRTIETVRRSLFTWALETVVEPGMSINIFDQKVTQKQRSMVDDLEPYIGLNPKFMDSPIFGSLRE